MSIGLYSVIDSSSGEPKTIAVIMHIFNKSAVIDR